MYKFDAEGFRNGCAAKHRPLFEKQAKSKDKEDAD
jgi:hypothetical protein